MVKFWNFSFSFDHPWSTVTQAIWRKYPNPFASHVLTADVIDRTVDPDTGFLVTTRLFLKQGNLPKWGRQFMNAPEAFILEISTVDPKGKTMETITRNLSHVKLMLVEERQIVRPHPDDPINRTELKTEARIISNTGWSSVRAQIEGFGLKRLKDHTVKSSHGLLHVLDQLTNIQLK
ncbi:hypothetical protein HDU97_003603 [Phlyctochytrium planicorne]|nr:hypothetical protein HDU97_003603 [Phlyctochytrium planicorne]